MKWVLALLLVPLIAMAATAAMAAPIRVAIEPLRDAAHGSPEAAEVTRALAGEIRALPFLELVKTGASRLLAVDDARLGDGRVLYLQGVEAGSNKVVGSTTVALSGGSGKVAPGDLPAVRAALVRVLAPERYLGKLVVKVDVPGAEAQLDGKKIAAGAPVEVPVGTHALRVTQPAYRDFLRFVDVGYDQTVALDVALSAYPLAEGEMTEKLRRQAAPKRKLPWYRTWWALTLSGVVLTGVTAGVVLLARPGIASDRTVQYRVMPSP